MKIGISTIIDYDNYGNRLQNYAGQEVLKSLGFEVETIPDIPVVSKPKEVSLKSKIKKSILRGLRGISPSYKKKIDTMLYNQKFRKERFIEFTQKNIKMCNVEINNFSDLCQLDNKFDYFITGSDQVWNYNFRPYLDKDFLGFVSKEKRISYASSFGVSSLPEDYIEKYHKFLSEMNYLSVREHAGQRIIKDLTGRDAQVLIDPTMMLHKDEWLQIASKPKCTPNKKYLLTYVLGNQTDEFKDFVDCLAKEKDLEVLSLLNPYDKDIHCVDPGEFVYLINQADVMITDSFHGAVFSILMETPFVIFERQDSFVSMNSRIETLVTTFKMESRLSSHIKTVDDVYNIDFTHIDEILNYERHKAIDYLKKAFSME